MKVALHMNGRIEVELQPENEIERVTLSEMLVRAERGQAVRLETLRIAGESAGAIVALEK